MPLNGAVLLNSVIDIGSGVCIQYYSTKVVRTSTTFSSLHLVAALGIFICVDLLVTSRGKAPVGVLGEVPPKLKQFADIVYRF